MKKRPGWITFPIIPPNSDGSCGCGDKDCKNAGKHPACKWGQKSLAPGESVPIPEGFNEGVATGTRSGIIIFDLDRKNSVDGVTNLFAMGDVPETLTNATPTGGFHLIYKHPGKGIKMPNSASAIAPGVDFRGDGGYAVINGKHKNGKHYQSIDDTAEIAECPQWMIDLVLNPKAVNRIVKRDTLERIAKTWRRSKSIIKQELGIAMDAVVKGESFADAGSRDTTLWQLASALPAVIPDADLPKLAELFVPSLELMEREAPDAPTLEDVQEKLSRAYADVQAAAGGAWTSQLSLTTQGIPKGTLGNALVVLANHQDTQGLIVYDERRGREVLMRNPPWASPEDTPAPRDVTDTDAAHMTTWLAHALGMDTGDLICRTAINAEAQLHRFDRVREEMIALEGTWDGVPRLDRWLIDYAGADDNEYIRTVSAKFVISAIARVFDPGCKVDTMLILEGEQGEFKSTLLRTLAGTANFADDLPDLESKDAKAYLRGPWIIEVKELGAFDRTHTNFIKSFLDQQSDRFRDAYASKTIDNPRRCVFAGTTNLRTYLKDPTGNRRYWPVRIITCLYKELGVQRGQILAEGIHRFRSGEEWWLDKTQALLAGEEQALREEGADPWTDRITEALDQGALKKFSEASRQDFAIPPMTESVSTAEIIEHVIGIHIAYINRGHEMRVAAILQKMKWERKLRVFNGKNSWRYYRPLNLLRLAK